MTAGTPGRRLRDLLATGDLVVAPGVYDGLSAALAERLGFRAAYMTGAGVSVAGFGLPDVGLVGGSEMAERARMLTAASSLPLVADADTGYGAPTNVARTVRDYERAGVAAIQLEDQAYPKRCGHLPDKRLVATEAFVAKLGAALDARADDDTVIVARTDARGPLGLDEAIDRAGRYAAAGADLLFVEAPQSVDEIRRIAAEVDAPLLLNVVPGGLTPETDAALLRELGFRLAIHPAVVLAAHARAAAAALTELRAATGDLAGADVDLPVPTGPAAIFELVGLSDWNALGDRFAVPPGEREA